MGVSVLHERPENKGDGDMTQEYLPGIPGSTETGWVPPADGFTKEDIVGWLGQLQGKMEAIWWNLGDMMNAGEITLDDEIYQAYLVHYEEATIRRVRRVCAAYPMGKREAPHVSIWKHELLLTSRITEDQKEEILAKAADTIEGGSTFKEMRAEIEEAEQTPFGEPERITGGTFDAAPECPTCGAESAHWHRVPAELSSREPAKRGHLKAV